MAIRSRGNNNKILGYSEESLRALERGKYDQLTGRDPKYRTSQQQTNQVKELPRVKNMTKATPVNISASKATKPSTRYNNQNVLKTPRTSTRDTKFDKDLDELWNYRFGDFSGEVDYDPVMDIEQPHWQTLREQIKRKNKWTDDELDTRFKAYDDERLGKMADQEVENSIKLAKEHPGLATIASLGQNIGTMIEGAGTMVSNLLPTEYKAQSADDLRLNNTRAKEALRQTVKNEHLTANTDSKIANKVLDFIGQGAYDLGTGAVDRTIQKAIPFLGVGLEKAASANMHAQERGVDADKATLTGALAGGITALTEGISDKIQLKPGKTKFGNIAKAANKEGLENAIEDFATYLADAAVNRENSQIGATKNYYKDQGSSDAKAWGQALLGTGADLLSSYGVGALAGGGLTALNNLPSLIAGNKANTNIPEIDNAIKQTADAEAKIQELSEQIPKTENRQLTDEELDALNAELNNMWAPEAGTSAPTTKQNVDFKASVHNADGQLLNTVKVPEYSADSNVYFNGSDADITMAEAQEAAIIDTFKNIVSDPEFNALSFKNGNKEVFVSPATNGNGLRMSYTIDGVPTGHHDYSLDQLDELSKSLRNEAGNGGEDIKVQRKSDLAKKAENKVVNESAPRNPRLVQKLEGEERVQAETKKKQNDKDIRSINRVVKTIDDSLKTATGKRKAELEAQKKENLDRKTALQAENKELKRSLEGGTIPIEKYLKDTNSELHKELYGRKTGFFDNLNYVGKHAGDTPEAKQLVKDIKKSIEAFIETGDINSTIYSPETISKINKLDDLANTVDKEYIGHFSDNAIFSGKDGKASIWNALEGTDEKGGLLNKLGRYYEENLRVNDATSAPTNLPPEYDLASRYAQLYRDFDAYDYDDTTFQGDDGIDRMADDIAKGRDLTQYISALENMIEEAPDADTEAKMQSLLSELQSINEGRVTTQNRIPTVEPANNEPPVNNMPHMDGMMPGDIPPAETTPANGEEKIRSFSRRGSEDTSLPDEVRNELKEDTYRVVRNADTEARADELFDENNLTQTRSNLEQAVRSHDPAAAPLSYKLAKAYIDAGDYDAATDVIESVSAELTRGGQFTQAAKLAMMQNDPMAAMRAYKKDLQNVNQWGKEKYGKKWNKLELSQEDMDLFNSVSKGDKEALNNVVSQLNTKFGRQVPATLWDKLVAASKTSMLLNLRTQGRNIISNAAMLPVRSLSDRVSAVGQNIAHLINPNVKVTQSVTGGTGEQKDIAKQVFENLRESILGENKMKDSTKSDILSNRQIFNDDFIGRFIDKQTNGGLQRLNEKLGGNANKSTMETLSNFTYWLMGDFGDTPFVRKNFVNRLASYMKAQGINNIDDIPDDAIAIATEEALKATFKDDNAFSNALSGIKKKSGKFGEIALPFVKTPANLAMRGIDYSPAGLINTFKKIRSGADANKVIDELAKNLTGTAMIFLGYKLREKGILSGNYSDDKDEKAWQKQQGMLENAVHVGDNYYTFDWAQPTSTPLIIGSVLFDATNNSDEENNGLLKAINSGKDAAVAVGNSWISTSPLQSLSDIMGGGEYNNDGGVAGNVLNEVIEFPQRFIPAQLGAAARTIDPVIRDTYSNDSTLTGTLGNQARALQSRIPQLSKKLPASYDTWGNERTRSDTKGEAFFAQNINPGQLGNKNETPLDAEITRIYEATGNKEVFPLSAARSLNLGDDGNIKLTNKQHSDYQKMLGQRSYKLAEELMNNKDFKALSDDEKAGTLKKAYDLSNALAKEELFDHVTDSDGKLKAAYKEKGEKGAVEYLIDSAKAKQLGLDVATYQKKQAEYKGGAEQYAKDKQNLNALNEKYGTKVSMETYTKQGATGTEKYIKDSQKAIDYGFTQKDGSANTDSYNKAVEIVGNNDNALKAYSNYQKKGFEKDAQKVPYLMNDRALTNEQKGKILRGTDPSKLGKAAKGMYDLGGYEGVYYYYLMKNLADTNQNGSVTKAERAALLNSDNQYVMQIPDDMYYYLGKNLK